MIVASVEQGNKPFTFFLENNPSWVTIDSGSGIVTANNAVIGTYEITIGVQDADGDISRSTFSLIVKEKNTLPVISLNKTSSLLEEGGADTIISTVVNGNKPFTFFLENNPSWVTVDTNGVVSIQNAVIGNYEIVVGVEDVDGDISKASFTLTVTEKNTTPIITLDRNSISIEEGSSEIIVSTVTGGNSPLGFF